VPRLIFIAVAVIIGWRAISFYVGYFESVQQLLK
jgi:hypothetical protein